MTFDVQIDGVPARLKVHRDGDLYRFQLGDQDERQAQLAEVEPGVFSVLLDGRSRQDNNSIARDPIELFGTKRLPSHAVTSFKFQVASFKLKH